MATQIGDRYEGGNRVLDALPLRERTEIAKLARVVHLASGDRIQHPGSDYLWVDFPIDAVLSVVATLEHGGTCEVGTIGNEGAFGIEVAFGAEVLRSTVCQVEGRVARIRRESFLRAADEYRVFERLIVRVAQAQRFFVEQQCACNAVHNIRHRCARWLLTLHYRAGRDTFELTHHFLAVMLGVRRASVSAAANALQRAGIIEYVRGRVTVLDRARLAAACCECYDTTKAVCDASLRVEDGRSDVRA